MPTTLGNLFSDIPDASPEEIFEKLHEQPGITIERILSNGQATAEGKWYDQDFDEWVLLVQGKGQLLFEDGTEQTLNTGDYLFIPQHQRHRVVRTEKSTIWLAIYIKD
ncbi:MAG: cupin domain-containing protein [Verrucomicrobia bacterium]|nr:cupin domain-containing protein [Verrucomicrobiota bacterium]